VISDALDGMEALAAFNVVSTVTVKVCLLLAQAQAGLNANTCPHDQQSCIR